MKMLYRNIILCSIISIFLTLFNKELLAQSSIQPLDFNPPQAGSLEPVSTPTAASLSLSDDITLQDNTATLEFTPELSWIEGLLRGIDETVSLADIIDTPAGFGLYATGVDLIDGNLEANFPASTKIEADDGKLLLELTMLPEYSDFRNNSFSFIFNKEEWDIKGAEFKDELVISLKDTSGNIVEITKEVSDGTKVEVSSEDIHSAAGEEFNYQVENIIIGFRFNVEGYDTTSRGKTETFTHGKIETAAGFSLNDFNV
ncbi:MAG: hypothetical protein P9L98_04810, partial [Candidatus Kaelpia imicola]|nr:hypothetical protein [Candidatus Kaelpia imicola]